MKAMDNDSSMEHQDIADEFKELREQLMALEKRFNPEKLNLHFGAPKKSMVWSGLWEEIDQLVSVSDKSLLNDGLKSPLHCSGE